MKRLFRTTNIPASVAGTLPVYYHDDYVARQHAFATTRKAALVAERCSADERFAITAPERASFDDLARVHTRSYLRALLTGKPVRKATTDGFPWDVNTWNSLARSAGGVVAAAKTALETGAAASLSSGLHHARSGHGSGFCAINGLALAAVLLTEDRKLKSPVLVLDLDAHGSGGTQSIIEDHPDILIADVVVSAFDPTHATARCRRHMVYEASGYLHAVESALAWCADKAPALVLYNAGVDVHERSDIGALEGITTQVVREREQMVARWAKEHGLPIAGVLAGGYPGDHLGDDELVDLHMLMLSELAALSTRTSG